MLQSTLRTTAMTFSALFAAGTIANAQTSTYDVTTLNGGYSYILSGSAIDPIFGQTTQIAEAGRLTADGAGNVFGSDTVIVSGSVIRRTFGGTYSVNSDGSGSMVLNPSWGPAIHADFVAGGHGRFLKLVLTDAGSTIAGAVESQQAANQTAPPQGYNASALQDGYEYRISGYGTDFWGNTIPIQEVGRLSADGAGNLTGSSTVTINGDVIRRSLSGTYSINTDGSGSALLYPSWGPPIDLDLFVAANGLNVNFVVTDAGSTLSGAMTVQSPPPAPTTTAMAQ